jgi:hypothetical protein
MAQQNIDFGTFPDDPSADAIRDAFQKVQNNFSQLFDATSSASVTSVNRSAGAGITVNAPTGNVVVSANISNIQISSPNLVVGTSLAVLASSAVYTSSTQTLYIAVPNTFTISNIVISGNSSVSGNLSVTGSTTLGNAVTANYFIGSGANLTNLPAANLVGSVPSATVANTVADNAQPNITSLGTLTSLVVTGNVSSGNANLGNAVTANYFIGSGANLTSLPGANVTGTVANATYALTSNTVVDNAQPNITSTGTLASLSVSGNANVGNIGTAGIITATGTITGGNLSTAGTLTATGNLTAGNISTAGVVTVTGNVTAGNIVTTGEISATGTLTAGDANLGNTANANYFIGNGYYLTDLNVTSIGTVANANYASYAGNITVNAQPNITSTGTLSSLSVSGNANVGNVGTTGIYAATLSSIGDANVGNLGTAGLITATGNITAGNIITTGLVSATGNGSFGNLLTDSISVTGNITGAGGTKSIDNIKIGFNTPATGSFTDLIASGTLSITGNANVGNLGTTGVYATTLSASGDANVGNIGTGGLITATGNVTGGNLITGGLITATGNVSAGNLVTGGSISATGNANVGNIGATTAILTTGNITTINSGLMQNGNSNVTIAANSDVTIYANSTTHAWVFGATGNLSIPESGQIRASSPFYGIVVSDYSNNSYVSSDATSTVIQGNSLVRIRTNGGQEFDFTASLANLGSANLVTTGDITGGNLSTGGALSVTGNANIGNIGANNAVFTTVAGTLSTQYQPNITRTGTLSVLTVSGNSNLGNINANGNITAETGHYFLGNGYYLTDVQSSGTSEIANGTSNVTVSSSSNVTVSVAGNANVVTVTGSSIIVTGEANISGYLFADSIETGNIKGTFTSGSNAQPNITSLGTLTGLTVSGVSNLGPVGNVKIGGGTTSTYLTTDGAGNLSWDVINNVPPGGIDGYVQYKKSGTFAGNANLTFNDTTGSLTIGGNVSANLVTGTLTTSAQPNITSVGTLTSLILSGNLNTNANIVTNAGDISATVGNISANLFIGNASSLYNFNGANVSGAVAYATTANSVSGANVSGEVSYAAVANSVSIANVSGIGNIATVNLDGNVSNILYGNGVFSSAPVTYSNSNVAAFLSSYGSNTITTTGNIIAGNILANGQSLTGLNGANVSGAVAYATTANSVSGANVSGAVAYATTANSVAVANVSGIGNIATINQDGNASNILYGNGVFAAAPTPGVSYGDSNVATFLASYGSNTITTTGNVSFGNIGTTGLVSAGSLTVTGTTNLGAVGNVTITGGTSGQFLKTDGSGALAWANGAVITDNTTTNASYYVTFTDASSGSLANVGVSTTKLYFNPSTGQLNATDFNSLSDKVTKTNIKQLENTSNIISLLTGVSFDWVDGTGSSYGFIAQDIEPVLPHAVSTNSEGKKSVNYSAVIPFLVETIKEQKQEIEALKASTRSLETSIEQVLALLRK